MSNAPYVPPTDAFFRAIVNSSSDAIFSVSLAGLVSSWNRGAERIFGYTEAEMVGQATTVLVPPDRMDEEPVIFEKARRGEFIQHLETIRVRKDGSLVEISLNVSPIHDDAGKVIGISKVARDITPQRREEERLRVTLASIGDGVVVTDPAGRVIMLNAVAEEITGWKEKDAVGRNYDDVLPLIDETTRRRIESPVTVVLRENRVVGLANHTLLIRQDGDERPIDDSAAPIRGRGGVVQGVVMVFRDVTERRGADLAARRLQAIVDGSDDAIISKNLQGIVTSWNPGAERIFGYTAAEMVGQSILRLMPSELQSQEQQILARLQRGERVDHFRTERLRKDGKRIHVSLTISPIHNSEGEIVGASKIARDITQIREAQDRLEQHARSLEEKVRERTQALEVTVSELEAFAYSLSHDMRAPLRAIRGLCEVVIEDYGAAMPQARALLERAVAAAHRLDRLIQDVLAFARVSRTEIAVHHVDLDPLVHRLLEERTEFAGRADVTVAGPLGAVMGDSVSLEQALTNLIDNAVKFTAPGTSAQVRIFTETRGDVVRIHVADSGIGIDPESRGRLFSTFQRLNPEGPHPGSGIGLAIVRKAVERMRGRVGVDSALGLGSVFWIELPKG